MTLSRFMNKKISSENLKLTGGGGGLENQFYSIIFLPLSLIFLKKIYSEIMNNFA